MGTEHLTIAADLPRLTGATMLLALTGWMDGGLVSTGTVRRLVEEREAREVGRIDADPFYILNFPGSMEVAAVFRPIVVYEDGLIKDLDLPGNVFYCDEPANLIFFTGREPNLRWEAFADCVFEMARQAGVARIIFIGSFGGRVPHTREPRLYGSVSHARLRPLLDEYGVRPSDYHGPSGFSTFLLAQAEHRGVEMLSLVAEIPGYLDGLNPLSIMAVTRRLALLLNQPVNLDKLREASNEWEAQVTQAVEKDDKLAATIRKLEEKYDEELIGKASVEEEHEDDDEDDEDEPDD